MPPDSLHTPEGNIAAELRRLVAENTRLQARVRRAETSAATQALRAQAWHWQFRC